jgi:hypothetical protein
MSYVDEVKADMRAEGLDDSDVEMVVAASQRRMPVSGHGRSSYTIHARVLAGIGRMMASYGADFRRFTGLDYPVFSREVVMPMEAKAEELKQLRNRDWTRGSQLPMNARILRMCMDLKQIPMTVISSRFGQRDSTCRFDIVKLLKLARCAVVPKWIYLPKEDSHEYGCLMTGAGALNRHFSHCAYAADVTHQSTPKPRRGQDTLYNSHYKEHCWLYMAVCDTAGYFRFVAGPYRGSKSDSDILVRCGLLELFDRYVVAFSISNQLCLRQSIFD